MVIWTIIIGVEVGELGCNLKVELTGFAKQLNKECERKRKLKDDSKVFLVLRTKMVEFPLTVQV